MHSHLLLNRLTLHGHEHVKKDLKLSCETLSHASA